VEHNHQVKDEKPWDILKKLLNQKEFELLTGYTYSLPRDEMIHALFKLSQSDQELLITNIDPAKAAELIEDIPNFYAADALEHIEPVQAASIVNELASDDRVDILKEIEEGFATMMLSKLV
jgi:magnesium transporter